MSAPAVARTQGTGTDRLPGAGRRFPTLDGARGLAVLVVVAFHFGGGRFVRGGWIGVDLFLVLSGFLITWTLLDGHRHTGTTGLARFYLRRLRRLGPAAVVFLAIWAAVALVAGHRAWFTTYLELAPGEHGPGVAPAQVAAMLLAGLSLSFNWWLIAGAQFFPIGHLWSLAVEEQFYLVWPTVVALLARRGRVLLGICAVAACLSAALPYAIHADQLRTSYGTDIRAQALLLGALVAVAHASGRLPRPPASVLRHAGHVALALFVVAALFLPGNAPMYPVVYTVLAVVAGTLVTVAVQSNGPAWLNRAPLRWLGQRSYALYLWHYPIAIWTHGYGPAGTVAGIGLSLAAAELSWRLIERRWQTRGSDRLGG